jgi:hypothetical protein
MNLQTFFFSVILIDHLKRKENQQNTTLIFETNNSHYWNANTMPFYFIKSIEKEHFY